MSGRRANVNRIRGPQSALTDFLAANNISAQQIRNSYEHRTRAAQQQNEVQDATEMEQETEILDPSTRVPKKRKLKDQKVEEKRKAKKKSKARELDEDSDSQGYDEDTHALGRDMYRKKKAAPGQLEHCELCNKRFTVTPYSKTGPEGSFLCTPCGKDQTIAQKKQAKPVQKVTVGKKRRQAESNRLDGLVNNGAKSLQELCIEKVADHHLDVEEFGDLPEIVLERLSQIFSKKRVLNPRTLKFFVRPDLKHISIHDAAYIESDDYMQMLAVAPHIQKLVIQNACQFKDVNLAYLAEKASRINYLQIYAANLVTDDAWKAFFKYCGHQLETLKLQWLDASFDDDVIEHMVKHCPNLKRLKLKYCRRMTAQSLLSITALQSLEHLSLHTTSPVSSDQLSSALAAVGSQLRTLSLEGFIEADDSVLASIGNGCGRLNKLRLTGLDNVTNEALSSMFSTSSALHPLRFVDLSGARDVDNNNPNGPSDEVIGLAAESFQKLMEHSRDIIEILDIASCRHIPHSAFCDVFGGSSIYPALREINLSFCGSVDSAVLLGMFKCCPALQKVTAFGCFKIEDVAVPRGIALIGVPRAQDAIEQYGDVDLALSSFVDSASQTVQVNA